jgi:hypothetical protein
VAVGCACNFKNAYQKTKFTEFIYRFSVKIFSGNAQRPVASQPITKKGKNKHAGKRSIAAKGNKNAKKIDAK